MAGIHSLQHIESFFASDLTDYDPIGSHTQGVDNKLALPYCTFAFYVWRARLEPDHVFLF
jgi:hypothetical protein